MNLIPSVLESTFCINHVVWLECCSELFCSCSECVDPCLLSPPCLCLQTVGVGSSTRMALIGKRRVQMKRDENFLPRHLFSQASAHHPDARHYTLCWSCLTLSWKYSDVRLFSYRMCAIELPCKTHSNRSVLGVSGFTHTHSWVVRRGLVVASERAVRLVTMERSRTVALSNTFQTKTAHFNMFFLGFDLP